MLTLANQVPTISPNYTRVELDLIHAIGYSVVVAGIMVALWLCVGLLVWLDRRRLYAPALRSDTPQPSLADRNRREVIGWQLASEKELNSFSPEKLQALLDSRNPFSDRITACEFSLRKGPNRLAHMTLPRS